MTRYIWQKPGWPTFSWDEGKLRVPLGECRLLQGKLLTQLGTLGMDLEHQVQTEILAEEAMKTSAIEGDHFDVPSLRASVATRLGLPSDQLSVDQGTVDVISVLLDATLNFASPLTPERLWGWQAALFPSGCSGSRKVTVGAWRDGSEPMRVVSRPSGKVKVHYQAPPSEALHTEMELFFSWWHDSDGKMEGIIRAAIAHFWFITIHPFDDGNGRIARVLTDMALVQDGTHHKRYCSVSSEILAERESYYAIVEKSQKGRGELTDWLLWFLGCFKRALVSSDVVVSGVKGI
jgi:Fic family protein